MRIAAGIALVLAALCGPTNAQQVLPGFPPGMFTNKAASDPPAGGGGGCSPGTNATAYLNNFGGTFNSTYQAAFCTLINGLDTNSLYSKFDSFFILGNQTSADAVIPVTFITATATASFSSGAASISIGSCPSGLGASSFGLQIYDSTKGQLITTPSRAVLSCIAGTVAIGGAGTTAASAGSTDLLYFYYSPVLNGAPTFAANGGYTGTDASSTVYIDTGYSLATATQCTQNNCNVGIWVNTQVTAGVSGGTCAGLLSGSTGTRIFPTYNDGKTYMDILVSATGDYGATNALGKGQFLANRSGATAVQYYINGSSVGSTSTTSSSPPTNNLVILASSNSGTISFGCGNQVAAYWTGSSLTSGQVSTLFSLLDAFGAAVGWGYH